MTIAERVELYKKLYKECKAVVPVAEIVGGFESATPLTRLDRLRECTTKLVGKDGYYGCICPTVTAFYQPTTYVRATNEIMVSEPDIKDFLRMFRLHLQNMARDPAKEDLLIEGNEGITKQVLFKEAECKLYGWDDAVAWADMILEVIERATL